MKQLILAGAIVLMSCSEAPAPLVGTNSVVGDAIPQALTKAAGDYDSGEFIFVDRDLGHCILCHVVRGLDAEFQGDVGPDLSGVGDRLDAGQLRLRIVDYQIVRPGTLMPSYYRIHDLYQVGNSFDGKAILSAQDVEDLVAYLSAQTLEQDDG